MQTLKLKKKYEAYSGYKDSDVEWLGKIPQDWSVVPLRSVALKNERMNSNGNCQNLFSLSYGKIIGKDITLNEGLLPESFNTYQVVRKGNIVFRLTDLQNDKKSLRVGYVDFDEPGIITSAYLALKIEKIDEKYAYYLLHAYDLLKVYYGMGSGVRQTLDFKDFKYLSIIVPSPKEQLKIVSFLDDKTKKINAIIEKKHKQIELLREKRSALISTAVTKVIGNTQKLKYIAPERRIKLNMAPNDFKYIGLENIESGTGKLFDSKEKSEPESSVNLFKKNDVLFGKLRPYLAKVFVPNFEGVCSSEFLTLVPKTNKIISRYLFYRLVSGEFIKAVDNSTYGTKMPRTNWQVIGNQKVTFPPHDEQEKIVKLLDSKINLFEKLINDTNKSIEKLQEFKFSIISNAVTGKIKV